VEGQPWVPRGFAVSKALCNEFVCGDYDEVVVVNRPATVQAEQQQDLRVVESAPLPLAQSGSVRPAVYPAGIGDHDRAKQCRRGDRLDRICLRPIPRLSWSLWAALLTTAFFWLFSSELLCRNPIMGDHSPGASIFLLPHLGTRLITGWLYNGAGSSVLIAGLLHPMHNAIVNSTGLVAVVALPHVEVLLIMGGIVVLAAAIIAVTTRGRLGLNRSSGPSATT
jgi:hypothetical protein